MDEHPELSEAFHWLDANLVDASDAPDEAFDWIWIANPSDWSELLRVWDSRPVSWRESLAYVAGYGPARLSRPLLRQALFDANIAVAEEAANSLCHQWLDSGSNQREPLFEDELVVRIRDVYRMGNEKNMDHIPEFLATFASGEIGETS